ncbi:MAG: ATP-binding protein [Thermoguttaceae bacterium]|nr:ATP-binding protein [Thermoguttaceae bacterium]
MDFIGREEELRFLEEKYSSKKGELVILYGRRRVGKTETLRRFCRGKKHIFHSCAETSDRDQLAAFGTRILAEHPAASRYLTRFENWETAFRSIAELPGAEKKLLVIDEFPYMVRGNRSIPSVLQNLWDAELKDRNVMIVLCGSAMSFIEKEILAEKNPLYGRATGILKMLPMDFYDAARFFPNKSPADLIALYSILGGVPYYLSQFDPSASVETNVCDHILRRGAVLYNEIEFLVRQELREPALYNSVIEAVALGNTRLNEIHQKTQIERSKLSVYLGNLAEIGLIRRELPVSESPKGEANVQRGLYRITDPFFRFWYAFVFPNVSELEYGDPKSAYRHLVRPRLDWFVSLAFEDVCRNYLRRLNRAERLPFYFARIGRWWNKTAEIDVMATDVRRENLLLGECKFRSAAMTPADLEKLRAKFQTDGWKEVYYYLFSKSGFTPALKKIAANENVILVDLPRLVREPRRGAKPHGQ